MAAINPLRYRGYYYDQETGLYFLMSRYYDPAICRFINADSFASTGQGILGHNMFAYCRNNPVCRKDATGTDDLTVTDVNDNDNPLDDIGPYYRPGGATASGGTKTAEGNGFNTYKQLKQSIGSPGVGNEWHHIVEQRQISKSGFDPKMVQNTNNIVSVSQSAHRRISGYYSSIQPFTSGMTVRDWLVGQSFSDQYAFGIAIIELFR